MLAEKRGDNLTGPQQRPNVTFIVICIENVKDLGSLMPSNRVRFLQLIEIPPKLHELGVKQQLGGS